MSAALAKFVVALCGVCLSTLTAINAYGLSIKSWPWLVFGNIGVLILLGIANAKDES